MTVESRRLFVYACVFYMALVLVMTFPLVRHLASTIPHDLGDPLVSTTILWWNAHTRPLTERWWDGFAFYPATGTMAFSDHRLGESLIATPLQWLGASPVAAYNVTLLATFPLCAIAAHWLAFTLTRRHDAALLCGLSYGFCPYRIAHLQHLELLAGAAMPAALAALHRYRQTGAVRWLAWFTLALAVQGLCTSYYLLFFTVLLAMWMVWFVGWRESQPLARIALAAAAAVILLLPIIRGYERIHAWYGLERRFDEIQRLSADVTALGIASPLLALWGWTSRWARSEGELFPGAAIAALALGGCITAWRRSPFARERTAGLVKWTFAAAGVFLAIAIAGWFASPWHLAVAGVRMSSDAPFKPFSLALAAAAMALAATARVRNAFARRAPLAFYAIATIVLFLCSLGPTPAVNGHQILYEPIYAWLMRLPAFGAVRVPARFAMPMMLTLSLTAALALGHLRMTDRRLRGVVALLACGIIADAWISQLPLVPLPDVWPASRASEFSAVLELPLGDVFDDAAAMYRASVHGRPLVNGSSGFEPTHYFTLRTALEEHDLSALDGLPPNLRLLIVVDAQKDPRHEWRSYAAALPHATAIADDGRWTFFEARPVPAPAICRGRALAIAGIAGDDGPADAGILTDRDPKTWWRASHSQRAGDALRIDLGAEAAPDAVLISVGEFRKSYPRKLAIDTSLDERAWTTVAVTRTAGLTMRGALENPKSVSIAIPLAASTARFVRLRVDEPHPTIAWMATDISVITCRAPE